MPVSDDNLPAPASHQYLLRGLRVPTLTSADVRAHCAVPLLADARTLAGVQPEELAVDQGIFSAAPGAAGVLAFPAVAVQQLPQGLLLACACLQPNTSLCEHEALVLLSIVQRKELRLFFDAPARHAFLRTAARDYGLEDAADPDEHFRLDYQRPGTLSVVPRRPDLYPVTSTANQELVTQLLAGARRTPPPPPAQQQLLVLARHRYYGHLTLQLAEAATTTTGKLKNPVTVLSPLDGIWQLEQPAEVKFFTGIARLQQNYDDARSPAVLEALRAVVHNPLGLPVYTHSAAVSEKLTAPSLTPVRLRRAPLDLHLRVAEQGEYYEVTGQLRLDDLPLDLKTLTVAFDYFVAVHDTFYLLDDPQVWRVLDFFQQRNNTLLIHRRKFADFQREVLSQLEDRLHIHYDHVRPATPTERVALGFDAAPEPLLYLTDAGAHVELLPVMRYGPKEVPVLSRRQLHATDELGRPFVVERDAAAETRFTAALMRHFPDFQEQLSQEALYVPKADFLQPEWFLEAFEDWRQQGVIILGFNQLKQNTLNPYKARVTVRVSGETNWFDTELRVQFGGQQVSLRHLQKAVRNRSRYVQLDDGTRGLLPEEWVEKFAAYFAAGEVVGEVIRTPSVSFATLAELYDPAALTPATHAQLARYQAAVADFTGIAPVPVPAGLRATLREYQQQGLNWLNFLDTFGFGGCLADDMGLGKTVQVLALLLHLRAQGRRGAHLVVVPTSLVFNWQAEAARFAPELRVHVLHGAARRTDAQAFADADLVLTTYNTMVNDIRWLREYAFDYVILDEAQAIKNPDSQRYKAARLLQASRRLVLTGTPVENNTYDLYGQLSFACPGLLGSRQHFQDQYAAPIDKFKDTKRARQLQQKISPFVLRRTKAQVARELPAKTEMTLYCEMGEAQRRVYEACRLEYRAKLLGQHEDAGSKDHLHILQGLTRLRQLCDAPALLPDGDYAAPSAKLDALLTEIESRAGQHKILVFSQFVGMLDLIRAELTRRGIRHEYLTGQTRRRAAAVQAFQEDDAVRVFLVSLKAGGVGLNLTAADYVYLVDPWWNPAVENQAIDRSHRLGQTRPVVAVRLICPGTIEEKIMRLQEGKQQLAHELIRTDVALVKTLTRAELLTLFS
ncbi:DEAD/DEAH box helicase [Hymenobacter sp. CRA2]|uniref:DEAD/DEAH box helicase n=1 Tax=Hymenobacter sp. CRA2 TaxID=1955620 RepID=UPI0009D49DB3|nr:DEAD/DEAH box helicase [Hymenobacter sp. CRA2]OON68946.1 DNA helicase [Hymenobacter sp. CRA2]